MKRIILTLSLLLVILVSLFYLLFYLSFNLLNPDNAINKQFRKTFIANCSWRNIFKLHQVGDSRFDYATDKNFSRLEIIVYYQEDETLDWQTIQEAVREIQSVVEKPQGIKVQETDLVGFAEASVDDEGLRKLIKDNPVKFLGSEKTAVVQIFILKQYSPAPTFAGIVKDDRNIFLFMEAIRKVSDYQISTFNAEISTILHEFGHLLGAGHVDSAGCILSELAEDLESGFRTNFRTSYCEEDLEEIRSATTLGQ